VVEIPSVPGEGFSLDTLRYVLESRKINVFFCIPSFSNPLGNCMSVSRRESLVSLLREFGVPMIEDDIYASLYFGKKRPPSCYSLAGRGEVILCSSFSKTLGPGLRTGWIVPGPYREKIIRLKTLLNLGNNSIQELTLARYLEGRTYSVHMKRVRAALTRQMQQLRRTVLESFPEGTRTTVPEGGLVLWVTLPGEFDTMELYRAVQDRDIFFAPGKLFSLKRDYSSSLRVNGGAWSEKNIEARRYVVETACRLAGGSRAGS
jgi:DNA-binding transcriptional MocR family regulator